MADRNRCDHCDEAFHAGFKRGVAEGSGEWRIQEIERLNRKLDARNAKCVEIEERLVAARGALKEALDLIDHLFEKVPWGKTAGVDFQRLNEVPIDGRRVLEATEGKARPAYQVVEDVDGPGLVKKPTLTIIEDTLPRDDGRPHCICTKWDIDGFTADPNCPRHGGSK